MEDGYLYKQWAINGNKSTKMKLERSIPFFTSLIKSPKSSRMTILQTFPSYVIDDLLEIIINIVHGNINVSHSKRDVLKQHKKSLLTLLNSRNKKAMRYFFINKQDGGFIAALLPIALAALGLTHLNK